MRALCSLGVVDIEILVIMDQLDLWKKWTNDAKVQSQSASLLLQTTSAPSLSWAAIINYLNIRQSFQWLLQWDCLVSADEALVLLGPVTEAISKQKTLEAPRLDWLQLKWSCKTDLLNKRKNVYSFLLTSHHLSWERKTDAALWSMGRRLRCLGKVPQNSAKHRKSQAIPNVINQAWVNFKANYELWVNFESRRTLTWKVSL